MHEPLCQNKDSRPCSIFMEGRHDGVFGDEKPKYLNSAENPIFHKSNTLYGLNLAKNANHDY